MGLWMGRRNPPTRVIPEVAERLSGTHEHLMGQNLAKPRLSRPSWREWVPVLLRKPG
jgi:hypothetical protein